MISRANPIVAATLSECERQESAKHRFQQAYECPGCHSLTPDILFLSSAHLWLHLVGCTHYRRLFADATPDIPLTRNEP